MSGWQASMRNADLAALVRTIPDFPKPGVQFRDITTLLLDGRGLRETVDRLAGAFDASGIDLVAGIESRGFVFAAGIAHVLGRGVLLIRKKNKLPGSVIGVDYELEYGTDRIEMHADACAPGARVLLVDDLIATGGTALAAVSLLRNAQASVEAGAFVIDLPDLGGSAKLRNRGLRIETLLEFKGN
jgi:adenine phosphoribosyltransferase